ncbi:LacI family DNA-binding transcriptional regulator [Trueperella pyogenes]
MSVTIRDVAEAAGVSITTVSRALNAEAGVSPVTQERILEHAHALGYSPNRSAQSLRRAATNVVGLVIKGPANPFFTELMEPIERYLRCRGYVVSILRVLHDDDELAAAVEFATSYRVSGMIMLGGWRSVGQDNWMKIPVPAVLCTVPEIIGADRETYSSVAVDDAQAMELIVAHLLDCGHQRIAFIGPAKGDNSIGASRMAHFVESLHRHGYEQDRSLLLHGESTSSYSYAYGERVTRQFLADGGDATALVCMSDVIAIGALRALADAGVRVPEEMAVTGFDGITLASYTSPRLTTVRQPIREIAERTCEVLFARMRTPVAHHLLIPATLVEAESTVGRPR